MESEEPMETIESGLSQEMESAARRDQKVNSLVGHIKEALESVRALSQKMEAIEGFSNSADLSGSLASFMKLEEKVKKVAEERLATLESSYLLEVEGLKDQVQHSEEQRVELKLKLDEASSQLASLLKSIDVAPASEDFKDRMTAFECWLTHMNEKLSSYSTLEESLQLTREKVSRVERELLESRQQVENLVNEFNQVEVKKNELENKLVIANAKINDLLQVASDQANKIWSQAQQLDRMAVEQSLATDQLKQLSAQHESSVAVLEASNRDLSCKVNHLQLKLFENEKRRIRLVDSLAEMSETVDQLEIEKRDFQRKISSLESNKLETSKDSRMLRGTIASIQSSFSESLIELAEMRCELKKLKSDMESNPNPMPDCNSRQKCAEPLQLNPTNGSMEGQNRDEGATDENESGHLARLRNELTDFKARVSGLTAELEQEKLRHSKSRAPDALEPAVELTSPEDLNGQITEQTIEMRNLLKENIELRRKLVEVYPSLNEQYKTLVEFERDGGLYEQVLPWNSRSELVGLTPMEIKAKIWDELTFTERYVLNENCLEEVLDQLAMGIPKTVDNTESETETPAVLDAGSTSGDVETNTAEAEVLRTPMKLTWRDTRSETAILDESSFFPTPILNPPTCPRNKRQSTTQGQYESTNDDLDSPDWARNRSELIKKPKLVLTNEPKPANE